MKVKEIGIGVDGFDFDKPEDYQANNNALLRNGFDGDLNCGDWTEGLGYDNRAECNNGRKEWAKKHNVDWKTETSECLAVSTKTITGDHKWSGEEGGIVKGAGGDALGALTEIYCFRAKTHKKEEQDACVKAAKLAGYKYCVPYRLDINKLAGKDRRIYNDKPYYTPCEYKGNRLSIRGKTCFNTDIYNHTKFKTLTNIECSSKEDCVDKANNKKMGKFGVDWNIIYIRDGKNWLSGEPEFTYHIVKK